MEWEAIVWFALLGFAAQLVDGALGMAYGVIASSVLLSMGVPPAVASKTVHAAEVVTTGVSAVSHALHRNVDWRLFRRLAVPGAIGGVIGATVLASVDGDAARPWVSAWLLALGVVILARGLRAVLPPPSEARHPIAIGFFAGLLDAIGGGGWGPIATSTLLTQGLSPRIAIGTVNTVEFVVTVAITLAFVVALDTVYWTAIIGLLAGGALAAPLAAWAVRHAPARVVMLVVGSFVIALSAWNLYRAVLAP
jgi:uncharacterized membrane protein YfcA